MAKKAVATFSGNKENKRNFVKCIRMAKSPKTGAYTFEEEMVGVESVKDFSVVSCASF